MYTVTYRRETQITKVPNKTKQVKQNKKQKNTEAANTTGMRYRQRSRGVYSRVEHPVGNINIYGFRDCVLF